MISHGCVQLPTSANERVSFTVEAPTGTYCYPWHTVVSSRLDNTGVAENVLYINTPRSSIVIVGTDLINLQRHFRDQDFLALERGESDRFTVRTITVNDAHDDL